MNIPLVNFARKYRHENENSGSKDDISLMELAERLKANNQDGVRSLIRTVRVSETLTEVEDMDFINEFSCNNLVIEAPYNMVINEVQRNGKNKSKKMERDYQKYMT